MTLPKIELPVWFKEATKELFRVVLLAIVPVLIDMMSKGQIDWNTVGVIAMLAGLRYVDVLLHEKGKEIGNSTLEKGVTRF